jgi:anaerobic ribonucleoside-triphosphate reductase
MGNKVCKCHSSSLYSMLSRCPSCGHNSFDMLAFACERRRCGYLQSDEEIAKLRGAEVPRQEALFSKESFQ